MLQCITKILGLGGDKPTKEESDSITLDKVVKVIESVSFCRAK